MSELQNECRFDSWVRKIPWRRKWQATSVFLPWKSHGQRSLAGYSPWGCKEPDMAEQLSIANVTWLSAEFSFFVRAVNQLSVSSVLEILTYHFFKYCFSETQNFFVGLQNFYLLWFCVLGTILSQIFAKLTSSNCFCSLHKLHDFKEFFHDYLISNLILLYHFLALLFSS